MTSGAPTLSDPGTAAPGKVQRFHVEGMDCASCARTVEKVIAGLDGVRAADVSFGNATLRVEGELDAARIETAVRRAGYAARPLGAPPPPPAPFWRRNVRTSSTAAAVALLVAAVAAWLLGAPDAVTTLLYLLSMAVGGWPIARAALGALRRRTLDMNVLMSLAALGAVGIGAYAEGAWVLVLFALGTTIESYALDRSRRSVEALMELAPAEANLLVDGRVEAVPVESVPPGARVLIRAGERLPLDGVVIDGASSVDESALTGESVPVDKMAGAPVFAGTLNAFGALTVEVTAASSDSALARVARLVAEAQGSRAPSERFVDRFARVYTPLVFAAALLVALVPTLLGESFDTWLYRGLALLIVACPCALVISVPVSVVSAIGGAARRGVLIKSGQALEDLGRVRVIALDKTGTLTAGTPELASVTVLDGGDEDETLRLMAAVERGSEHPLALALVRAAEARRLTPPPVADFVALPGRGARARVGGALLWAGGPRLAEEQGAVAPRELEAAESRGETAVLLGEGPHVRAVFGLSDQPRPQAAGAVAALQMGGEVRHLVMLTGDSERVARAVAARVGITEWRAGLLPEDKLAAVRDLEEQVGPTAMVGDGVNDAPALTAARVGVAMGAAGSDVALESADVALMGDELLRLPEMLRHSRRALRIMRQNVVISLATKAVFVLLAPLGYVSLIVAVAADMGVSLLVTLNGLRLLGRPGSDPPARAEETPACGDGRDCAAGAPGGAAPARTLPLLRVAPGARESEASAQRPRATTGLPGSGSAPVTADPCCAPSAAPSDPSDHCEEPCCGPPLAPPRAVDACGSGCCSADQPPETASRPGAPGP